MIELKSDLDNLNQFISYIRENAEKAEMSSDSIKQIELAAEEALVNIINYAYKGIVGNIGIACRIENNCFFVEISDTGIAFDISDWENPDTGAGIEEREIGGLGIFFIKKFMDDIKYERLKERNILTLIKKVNNIK